MTCKAILRGVKPVILAVLVLCLSPASRVAAAGRSKISPGAPKSLRYLVSREFYTVRSGKIFDRLSDPLPLNDFIDDLGKRIGRGRVVPPETVQPGGCTDEAPCEQVWFREEPDPGNVGMQQMVVWLQRQPTAGIVCEYVTERDRPLREPVGALGEEDAQKRLLLGAAVQLSSYDQRRGSTQSHPLLVNR